MEIEGRDFINSPPIKTVRFGGNVAETLAKHKRVSGDVTFKCSSMTLRAPLIDSNLLSIKGGLKGLRAPDTSVDRP